MAYTIPIGVGAFLGKALDLTARGTDGVKVLNLSENELAGAGSPTLTIAADSVVGYGNALRLYLADSSPTGTRGTDTSFGATEPEWKPLGDPQADGGNIAAHDEMFVHMQISVTTGTFGTGAPATAYLEIGSFETTGHSDTRQISFRLYTDGQVAIVDRDTSLNAESAVGAYTTGTTRRMQIHVANPDANGGLGRLAFRIETATPYVYGSWVAVEHATILDGHQIEKFRISNRDYNQNLHGSGASAPEVLAREIGWYVPLPQVDGSLTAEQACAYATPRPFGMCRTCKVDATTARILLCLHENALNDGGEATYEFGPVVSESDPLNPSAYEQYGAEYVHVTNTDTETLGATFRGSFVEFTGLSARTRYAWRVIAGGVTSDWREFRTPPAPGVEETVRFVHLCHAQSDGRRGLDLTFRRALEKYEAGEIDFVILGPKWIHFDNNGPYAPVLNAAQAFNAYSERHCDPYVSAFFESGCPTMLMLEEYDSGYATNTSYAFLGLTTDFPYLGHAGSGTAADSDYDFTAGRLLTYDAMASLGKSIFDTFHQGAFSDSAEYYFVQWGVVDFVFLHDRNTRDLNVGTVFFGSTQIDAVTARIGTAASRGVKLVEIWTPSTAGNEDGATDESWSSWNTERAPALQAWEDAADGQGVYLSYWSACKNEPAELKPDAMWARLTTNKRRIVSHGFVGKSWGRIPNHNSSLDANANVLSAFIVDNTNSLTDPYNGSANAVTAGDHVGWLPYREINPRGQGRTITKLLSTVSGAPVQDAARTSVFVSDRSLGMGQSRSDFRSRSRPYTRL